ncbi:sodium-dependent serotonin transporter [Trichonephila clavipes]|nr:sodium-dependent serotonin transporter [Trichonephila clavipes]
MLKKDISNVATDGQGLVFVVYPEAVATMSGSVFWSILFFLMLITLGLDSTFGGLEAMITGLCDQFPIHLRRNREIFVGFVVVFIYLCALPTCTFGGYYIVNLLDSYGTAMSLLFIVFVEAAAVCWIYGAERFSDQVKEMLGYRPGIFWRVCWKCISPVFILRRRTVRTEETTINYNATVERSIEEDPNESLRHRAQELDLCPSTLWKILRKDLGLRAYKIQLVQELKPNDHQARPHFWLHGYVNKQNCRIWSEANPQVYVETPLHPEKLTVWCALWAGGIIGPYFFKNNEGHNVTVNGDRYRAMITNFFIPELNNHDVQELWFHQDGAICHTARATIDLLKDTFGDRLISRF